MAAKTSPTRNKETFEIEFLPRQYEIHEDTHRFKVIVCGRRFGKALDLDTPILTTCGWKTIGTVEVGDIVFDEQGHQTTIQYVSPVFHDRTCYEVVFSDGHTVVADAAHEWVTEDKSYRKNTARTPHTSCTMKKVTTEQIRETLMHGKENNHSIPVAGPIQHDEKVLPLDPYLLGVWLGDGSTNSCELTTTDFEIVQAFEDAGYPCHLIKDRRGDATRYTITGLRGTLVALGVLGNKHIPDIYLRGSVEQRLALVQGLMDTDGTVSKKGHCDFTVVDRRLAEQFFELVQSLGIKASLITGDAKINGRIVGEKYRVTFTTTLPVVRLVQKKTRLPTETKSDVGRRFIVAVNPVASRPVRCIMVDSPSHLFCVTDGMIATHNTRYTAYEVILHALTTPDGMSWLIAPTYPLSMIMWRLVWKYIPKKYVESKKEGELYITLKNGHTIWAKSADKPENLVGEGLTLATFDEFGIMKERVWTESIRPALMDKHGKAIFIGTPKGKNHFYRLFKRGISDDPKDKDWKSFQFTSFENPILTEEELADVTQDMPELIYKQEILAQFIEMGGEVFLTYQAQMVEMQPPTSTDDFIVFGLDLATKEDYTVLIGYDVSTNRPVIFERFNHVLWESQIERLAQIFEKYRNHICYIDSTGVGDPIYERLRLLGVNVKGIVITSGQRVTGTSVPKRILIERLALMLEAREMWLPALKVVEDEFSEFEYQITEQGNVTYSAPDGGHDDIVMACALAAFGLERPSGVIGVVENPVNTQYNPESFASWDECERIADWDE